VCGGGGVCSAEEGSSDTDSHLGIFLRVRGGRQYSHRGG
jgi:hypothetical protein